MHVSPPNASPIEPSVARFLLVGIGPHAKRTYIKHLAALKKENRGELVAAVDIIPNQQKIEEYAATAMPDTELVFVPMFRQSMPQSVALQLAEVVERHGVDCVIIASEPEAHKSYGLWAIRLGLNVIMDKPITTRRDAVNDINEAAGISDDFNELLAAYTELQAKRDTFFLINSHRRYHPGFYCTNDMVSEIQQKTGCPVTNLVATHCDGLWRLPAEIVDQHYHPFRYGYGKLSHSGYHFLDTTYRFMRAGWSPGRRPDQIEVVSTFLMPNGVMESMNREEHRKIFGDAYDAATGYSDEELYKLMKNMGEYDAMIQFTFKNKGEVIATAHINLLHTGFSRRSWLDHGSSPDLYKGVGRVKHETHEIRSGPFQTIVIQSRQANDKHDRSKPSTAELGSDNHFEVQTWRNCDVLGEDEPLKVYAAGDLDRRYNVKLPGIYSENVKRGILWEALDYLHGKKGLDELSSNLPDHSLPAHFMSAAYVSHVRRTLGLNPITRINISHEPTDLFCPSLATLHPEDTQILQPRLLAQPQLHMDTYPQRKKLREMTKVRRTARVKSIGSGSARLYMSRRS